MRLEIVRDVTRKTVKQVLKGLDGAVIESLQGSTPVLPQKQGTEGQTPLLAQTTEGEHRKLLLSIEIKWLLKVLKKLVKK